MAKQGIIKSYRQIKKTLGILIVNVFNFLWGLKDEWLLLLKILLKRFFVGFGRVSFLLYFVVIIVILGGLGVWIEYFSETQNGLNNALTTFFMAILATSSADLLLKTKPEDEMGFLKMPALSILIIGGLMAALVFAGYCQEQLAKTGTILALMLWWIANSSDDKYLANGENPESKDYTGEEEEIQGEISTDFIQ